MRIGQLTGWVGVKMATRIVGGASPVKRVECRVLESTSKKSDTCLIRFNVPPAIAGQVIKIVAPQLMPSTREWVGRWGAIGIGRSIETALYQLGCFSIKSPPPFPLNENIIATARDILKIFPGIQELSAIPPNGLTIILDCTKRGFITLKWHTQKLAQPLYGAPVTFDSREAVAGRQIWLNTL